MEYPFRRTGKPHPGLHHPRTSKADPAPRHPELRSGGLPAPELFPKEEAARKAAEILRGKGEVALQYGPTEGYLPLRTWVADWLKVSPEEVLIYRELYFGQDRLPSLFELAREAGYPGVIYLSSFSKVLAPGLRVAFVMAQPEVILKLTQAKQGVDLHTPVLNQILVHELVKEGFPERLERIRATYRSKAQAMLEALDGEMPKEVRYTRPKGGMFVWMTLPEGLSAEVLFQRAIEENVAFVPGGPFFANGGGENTLRLSGRVRNYV